MHPRLNGKSICLAMGTHMMINGFPNKKGQHFPSCLLVIVTRDTLLCTTIDTLFYSISCLVFNLLLCCSILFHIWSLFYCSILNSSPPVLATLPSPSFSIPCPGRKSICCKTCWLEAWTSSDQLLCHRRCTSDQSCISYYLLSWHHPRSIKIWGH